MHILIFIFSLSISYAIFVGLFLHGILFKKQKLSSCEMITSPLVGEIDPKGRVRGSSVLQYGRVTESRKRWCILNSATLISAILAFANPSPAATRRPLPQGERYSLAFICILLFSLLSVPSVSAEVYEVVDTSLEADSQSIGGTETIITDTEIKDYQETFLKDALPYTPSVILNSAGTLGRAVDFSIRGARSSQNLVLVDGIYVNDPASGGGADLSNFLNADMERIEILPGPQNLSYGPGALGGVVQLIPKRGHGKPSVKALGEGGSFRTKYGTLIAQGEEGALQFSTTLAGFRRGPSSFTNPLHGNRQSDRYRNGTFSSRVGYAITDNWEVEGTLRYLEGKTQFDSLQFVAQENAFLPFKAPNFSTNKTLLASLENKWGNEKWDHSLKATYSHILRKTEMPSFHNQTLGEHPMIIYRADVKINCKNTLTTGFEGGQERAKEAGFHKRNHGGIYVIHLYKLFENTELKGGIRSDQYQSLGNRVTFNIGADQKVASTTTLRASYGTNFKPPVLSDLFQKNLPWQIPNPFLKPEKSRSVEAGLDQTFWEEKVKMNLTGFLTQIEHVVLSRLTSGGKWQRYNGGNRNTKGFEIAFSLSPEKTIELKTAFTFTHSRDLPSNTKSPLIPGFKGAGGIF